jgi:hypothetical protein
MVMTADAFRLWWIDLEQDDPFFAALNGHYAMVESRPEGFDHLGGFAFGDVLALKALPDEGFSTLITKGLSGFRLLTHGDDREMIRAELAWTMKTDCVSDATVGLLATVADFVLERRRGFHQNEIFAFDFSGLPFENRLTCFMASNGYWFADGFERLGSDIPMYVFELFALTREEANIALQDVETFARHVDANDIDLENLAR